MSQYIKLFRRAPEHAQPVAYLVLYIKNATDDFCSVGADITNLYIEEAEASNMRRTSPLWCVHVACAV